MFLFWELEIYNSNGNQADLFDYLWTSGIAGKVILNLCGRRQGINACGNPLHGDWHSILSLPELCTVMYRAVYTGVREETQKSLLLLLLKLSFAP